MGQIGEDEKVPRQTIHYWIENYVDDIEKIIPFKETCDYCTPLDIMYKISKSKKFTDKDYPSKKQMDLLRMVYKHYGRKYCMKKLKKNPKYFDNITEIRV